MLACQGRWLLEDIHELKKGIASYELIQKTRSQTMGPREMASGASGHELSLLAWRRLRLSFIAVLLLLRLPAPLLLRGRCLLLHLLWV